ncbi:MAG: PleD family two-component system response regulator [Alphaproteobacteria bacterium]|nr:PleD family two-component system response regulator [Alphaproteobacteria bacterium]
MTARILVVDDMSVNRNLLKTYLLAEYFDVMTAEDGLKAIEICLHEKIDLVLLDVVMPGMDGFEVCVRLKSDPRTHHIPVIMVTTLDMPADKVKGLDAGADDFLHKPVDEIALITRVKNMMRLKSLVDELRMRTESIRELDLNGDEKTTLEMSGEGGRILVIESDPERRILLRSILQKWHEVEMEGDPESALKRSLEETDLVIINIHLDGYDGLRLCSQIRLSEQTRNVPLIMILEPDNEVKLLRGLDLGVNDYVILPLDENELRARVSMQLKRARYAEKLRSKFQHNAELAVKDVLTGLYNRRYFEIYLDTFIKKAILQGQELSLLVSDIDHFKAVNDTYGHNIGDSVLREFAKRIKSSVRGTNLVCRYGGEEFVTVMPSMNLSQAYALGKRICKIIAEAPFKVEDIVIPVTTSIGIAGLEGAGDTPAMLFKRADQALYEAKRRGRNCVILQDILV